MNASTPFLARLAETPSLSDGVAVGRGLWSLALRTPTLPPAQHTNTIFVGQRHPFIVDPATPHEAERQRLLFAIETFQKADRAPAAIVLTHHHPDHVGAAVWLRAQAGLPIFAHTKTAALLPALAVDRELEDGEWLPGSDESSDRWRVDHTPGHASGHIILVEPDAGLIVGGDLVASVGTIVIDPPDGHMATYLATLERVRALDASALVPSHGAPLSPPEPVLSAYLEHRARREELVVDALGQSLGRGPASLADLAREAYRELAPALLPLARRAALAHLQKLCEEGRALAVDAQGTGPRHPLDPDACFVAA